MENKNSADVAASPLQSGVSCEHPATQGRDGEKGAWCIDCGAKVYEVETRPCGLCRHVKNIVYPSCTKKLMAVSLTMHVTYAIADGSCWESN